MIFHVCTDLSSCKVYFSPIHGGGVAIGDGGG